MTLLTLLVGGRANTLCVEGLQGGIELLLLLQLEV